MKFPIQKRGISGVTFSRDYRSSLMCGVLLVTSAANIANAQSGSLFRAPDGQNNTMGAAGQPDTGLSRPDPSFSVLPSANPMWDPNNSLHAASWTATPQLPPRTLKIHDIISIRVDELATTNALGNAQSRKAGLYDVRLNDWIEFVGWDTIKPSSQSDGDPRVKGTLDELYRATSNLQTREQMTFNIASEIADIRPNGTLVLSARKQIRQNDNIFEASLSGVCRAEDVGPDNVVLSRDIFELKIDKDDQGHVRDGYSRGWFTRWLARFKAF